MFKLNEISYKQDYDIVITPLGIKDIRHFKTRAHAHHTRTQEAVIQRETIIAGLTSQQLAQLESLRQQRKQSAADASRLKTMNPALRDGLMPTRPYRPDGIETLDDLFYKKGLILT
jgi:hypothetical protein